MKESSLKSRIESRLTALGMGAVEAAQSVDGLERNYIRDLLDGRKKSFSQSKLPLVAQALQLTVAELMGEGFLESKVPEPRALNATESKPVDTKNLANIGSINAQVEIPGAELFGRTDLPILGLGRNSLGALILTKHVVDWVPRPAPLQRVSDAYGLIVPDDAMRGPCPIGTTVLANPHIPARPGDLCIFRAGPATDGECVLIREFVGDTSSHWKLRQSNPSESYTLSKSEWPVCHKVVALFFA